MDTSYRFSARPRVRIERAIKRVGDALGAAVLLLGIAPLWLLIAVLIRLDSRGPVLFESERLGQLGRTFPCLKFRTMHPDAEDRFYRLLSSRPDLREEYERFHKLADDPRVTRIGRWLRATSLDELPQLWNVLVGDMSIVGPRPYMVRELDQMGAEKHLIFQVRPGITGHWQINGRNDVSFQERQEMEAFYVRNWTLRWDVKLFFATPLALLTRRGR